jgi:hypothetical protein
MKYIVTTIIVLGCFSFAPAVAQQDGYYIRTIFNTGARSSGGYAAMSNKFTRVGNEYANMVELYGGWYINHRFLVGIGAAATTNDIPVPSQHRTVSDLELSYEYGQVGLMTEYIIASHRAVHVGFQLFAGSGFTLQYEREKLSNDEGFENDNYDHDSNWFMVAEPGVKVEVNVFRWMRFAPGVSYRVAYGSDGKGLADSDVSGASLNLTLKFGKF